MENRKPFAILEEHRPRLERISRSRKGDPRKVVRARILLAKARGLSDGRVAELVRTDCSTVTKWVNRYRAIRPGQSIDGFLVGEDEPDDVTRSSEAGTEDSARGLQMENPGITVTEQWMDSFLRDLNGRIPEVWAVDGKARTAAFVRRSQDPLPVSPHERAAGPGTGMDRWSFCNGYAATVLGDDAHTPEMSRNIIAGISLNTGRVAGIVAPNRRPIYFIRFLEKLDTLRPKDHVLCILCESQRANRPRILKRYLQTVKGRFVFLCTPKHFFLNPCESFLAKLSRQFLNGLQTDTVEDLERRIILYFDECNQNPVVPKW